MDCIACECGKNVPKSEYRNHLRGGFHTALKARGEMLNKGLLPLLGVQGKMVENMGIQGKWTYWNYNPGCIGHHSHFIYAYWVPKQVHEITTSAESLHRRKAALLEIANHGH